MPEATSTLALKESQQIAYERLQRFVTDRRQKYFILSGYAGTGKTFLVCQIIKNLLSRGFRVKLGAPTNKAARNAESISKEKHGLQLSASTIASLLGQQPSINEDSGKEEFLSNSAKVRIGEYDVVFLDEYSMIGPKDLEQILEITQYKDVKLVFVGDEAQLPPINCKRSPVLNLSGREDTMLATLTEIIRYEGGIAHVAEDVRSNPHYGRNVYPYMTLVDESLVVLKYFDWMLRAIEDFKSEQFQEDINYCRLLVWRNQTAFKYNRGIRKHLFGVTDIEEDQWLEGDRLIARKPLFRSIDGRELIVACNSDEFIITGDKREVEDSKTGLKYWNVPAMDATTTQPISLRLATDLTKHLVEAKMAEAKAKKEWRTFYFYQKRFDDITYAYAITTHKAQGSTLRHAYIDARDMGPAKELQQLQYTALTRAAECAYIRVQ